MKSNIQMFLFAAGISILLIAGGYLFYTTGAKSIRSEKAGELQAIANLKTNQIVQWRKERMGDANVISQSDLLTEEISKLLNERNNYILKGKLIRHLQLLKTYYGYNNLFIATPDGDILVTTDTLTIQLDSIARQKVIEAATHKRVMFTDLYYCRTHNLIHLDIITTVISSKGVSAAVVILRVDPKDYLYPLVQTWPVPSKTSETLLVRKESDSVIFLNELRFRENTSLKFKISLDNSNIPAVKAVLGHIGIFEGKDYGGKKVLSYIEPVPGTDWYLVAKMSKSEIFSELRFRGIIVSLFTIIVVILINMGFRFILKSKQNNILQKLLQKETELRLNLEEHKTVLYSIGDAVITTGKSGIISRMNPIAEKLTGWNESEGIGMPIEVVFNIINEQEKKPVDNPVDKVLQNGVVVGLANHTLLVSKDGEEIPIADSGAPIRNESGEVAGVVLVFRDQSEEREIRNKLISSETKYRRLFESAKDGITIIEAESGKIVDLNPCLIKMLEYGQGDLLGKKIWETEPFRNITFSSDVFFNLLEEDFFYIEDIQFKTKSGNYIDVELVGNKYQAENSKFLLINFRDITQRKKYEKDLDQSRKYIKAVMDNLPLGVAVNSISPMVNFEYMNDNFPKIYRTTRELLKDPDTFWECVYEDKEFRDTIRNRVLEDCNSGNPDRMQWDDIPITREGEETRFISARNTMVPNMSLMISTVWDVTERKRNEEAIQKKSQELQLMLQNMLNAFVIWESVFNEDGEFISCRFGFFNEAYSRIAKVKLEDVRGKDIFEIWPGTENSWVEKYREVAMTGVPGTFDMYHGPTMGWYHCNAYRPANSPNQICVIFEDITERRRAEELLRINELRLRRFYESGLIGVIYWTMEGKVTEANDKFLEMVGYSREELMEGKIDWMNMTPREYKPLDDLKMEELKNDGVNKVPFEKEYIRKDGTRIPVVIAAATLEGERDTGVAFVLDITERKRVEEKIITLNEGLEERVAQRTAQLELINNELESFSYSVSHDLRAPLRALSGFSRILLDEYEEKLDQEGKRLCGVISSSADKMGSLIDDLLAFSRLGRSELNLNHVNMKNVIKSVIEELTTPESLKRIKFVFGPLPDVNADVVLIKQVWINLISNAIKYSSRKKLAKIEIGSFIKDSQTTYFIKDNGTGFDMQYVDKLFGVFHRLHNAKDFEGTGVGLAIVKRIVFRHNGVTWAEGKVNRGAVFYFSIPN